MHFGRSGGVSLGRAAAVLFLLLAVVGTGWAQSENVTLLGHLNNRASAGYSGVWGYTAPNGTELAIIGVGNGTSFVNVTDPANPVEVAFFTHPTTIWTEIRTFGHYAYWSNDQTASGLGIVDLVDPLHPVFVRFHTAFTTCHSLHMDTQTGYLYCNGCSSNRTFILNVGANPTNPPTVAIFSDYYVHDSYSRDGIAYFAAISDQALGIEDFTNPPTFINESFTQYAGAMTHNCWLTDDSRYLLTSDETSGGHLKIWDVLDKTNPTQVSEYSLPGDDSIIHNVYVRGNLAVASWYTAGLQIIDITDPLTPQRVGYYDTYPGTGGYDGAWGVYPFAASGNYYISDMTTGLYVFRFTPNYGTVNGTVTNANGGGPLAGVTVSAPSQGKSTTTNGAGHYSLNLTPGNVQVDFSKFGFGNTSRTVNIVLGQSITQNVTMGLLPTGTMSGVVRSSVGNTPLANALITLQATPLATNTGVGGNYTMAGIPTGSYTATASLFGYGETNIPVDVAAQQNTPRDFTLRPSVFADNAETNLGWSLGVAGDNATSGLWVRADPDGISGGVVQPEDDHSVPGVMCFVTGNCSPGCNPGDNDVDGGKTTLMSPTINLSGQTGATLVYYRFYSNNSGGNPSQDIFQVDISSNNGTSWVNLESLQQTHNFWEKMVFPIANYIPLTSQVKIRFIAQDTGGGSVVEAAVDDIEIMMPAPTVSVEPGLVSGVRLLAAAPNPLREQSVLRFAIDQSRRVSLQILDVSGREVRTLADGAMPAGEHSVVWDGRDSAGRLVPQGIYLQRLLTESVADSRKILVVR